MEYMSRNKLILQDTESIIQYFFMMKFIRYQVAGAIGNVVKKDLSQQKESSIVIAVIKWFIHLFCWRCTNEILRYYSCGVASSKGESVCVFHSIRADYAEQYILDRINEVVTYPKVLKKLVDKVNTYKKQMVKPLQEELEANKQAIQKVKVDILINFNLVII